MLLIEGVGVAGVPVLESGSLEEADRGEMTGAQRVEEIMTVILVVGWIARGAVIRIRGPDRADATRPRVHWVGSGGVVLERLVVWDVVVRNRAGIRRRLRRPAVAARRTV